MAYNKITILQGTLAKPIITKNLKVIAFEELKSLIVSGKIVNHFFRYREAKLLTYKLEYIPYPFLTAMLLRFLSRKSCSFQDEKGNCQSINLAFIFTLFIRLIKDIFEVKTLIRRNSEKLNKLAWESNSENNFKKQLDLAGSPVYLRTDLWFGVQSGGSVGHIAGVLNNLDNFSGKPVFLTTDYIPTVRDDIETHVVVPGNSFWDFREVLGFKLNMTMEPELLSLTEDRKISFVYQRYSTNNYSGVVLAKYYSIPFVLEYNGSQIWISRNWGRPLKYESLSEKIELINLHAADLVVVVSKPMLDELVGRGIDRDKILVNPNGVDSDRYSPLIDGSTVRHRYQLEGKTVVGFIGTFGKWHGAEKLAEAFGRLLKEYPEYKKSARLLMIGDGITMLEVKETLSRYGVEHFCILTGLIPQKEGPLHLAACDILASPHVPNPDGTPFFGSPTKLFEYMAMGKGIVASDLDQIGEILAHDRMAWMVKPGDIESLMEGIKRLIDDKQLRDRLGKAAREEVVAKYTWNEHTRKIVDSLKERCICIR